MSQISDATFVQGSFLVVDGNQYKFSSDMAAIAAARMLATLSDPDQPAVDCGYFVDSDSDTLAKLYLDFNL